MFRDRKICVKEPFGQVIFITDQENIFLSIVLILNGFLPM